MRLDHQILLKSSPTYLLAGSAPGSESTLTYLNALCGSSLSSYDRFVQTTATIAAMYLWKQSRNQKSNLFNIKWSVQKNAWEKQLIWKEDLEYLVSQFAKWTDDRVSNYEILSDSKTKDVIQIWNRFKVCIKYTLIKVLGWTLVFSVLLW